MTEKNYFVRFSAFAGPFDMDTAAELSDKLLSLAKKAGMAKATTEVEIFESTKNGGKRLVDEVVTT